MIRYILLLLALLSLAGCQSYDLAVPVELYKITDYVETEDFVKITYENSEYGEATITINFTENGQELLLGKISNSIERQNANYKEPLNLQVKNQNGLLFSLEQKSHSWFTGNSYITVQSDNHYAKSEVTYYYAQKYPSELTFRMLEQQKHLYSNPVAIEYFSRSEDLNGSIQLRNNQPTPIDNLKIYMPDYNGNLILVESDEISLQPGEMSEFSLILNSGCTKDLYGQAEVHFEYMADGNTYTSGPFVVNTWCD